MQEVKKEKLKLRKFFRQTKGSEDCLPAEIPPAGGMKAGAM